SADACTKEDDNQNMAKWKSPTKSGDLVRLFTVSSRLKPVNLYQDETVWPGTSLRSLSFGLAGGIASGLRPWLYSETCF
ncbi:MAG: hypothetical protein K9N35_09675, partial [Candidatus Marinimicrobia bacterium]|nr:hypothetical protein [Candidatus Neomarinimicrobiota bacterium]